MSRGTPIYGLKNVTHSSQTSLFPVLFFGSSLIFKFFSASRQGITDVLYLGMKQGSSDQWGLSSLFDTRCLLGMFGLFFASFFRINDTSQVGERFFFEFFLQALKKQT